MQQHTDRDRTTETKPPNQRTNPTTIPTDPNEKAPEEKEEGTVRKVEEEEEEKDTNAPAKP